MSKHKLSSSEVPAKFVDWLLDIGCSPDIVPTVDKVLDMCRGHYMVWRSLMEHVEPKDVIRQKRLQVFCNDVRKWKRKSYKYQKDTKAVEPNELILWNQHHDIRKKVANAENRVEDLQKELNELMEKISSSLSHCNLSQQRMQDIKRRVWLLQQVTEELKTKKANLEETKRIADSLCLINEDVDLQNQLDRYISSLRRPLHQNSSIVGNPIASSTFVSTNGDVNKPDEQMSWLMKCRGETLWTQLYERRAALVGSLTNDTSTQKPHNVGATPECVISHTAAMHCSLALEAIKNRTHSKQRRKALAAAVSQTGDHLTHEECELLVLQCERARASERVNTLRTLLQEVTSRNGIFCAGAQEAIDDTRSTVKQIVAIDKAIITKKQELQKLVTLLAVTEKKIHNIRDCLEALFSGLQKEPSPLHQERYRGQLDISQNSVSELRQFYEEKREAHKNKMQLSLDLDVSENSIGRLENGDLKFPDELNIYLKRFNLEKNRKLVLESGGKIWIFETLQTAVGKLHAKWLAANQTCSLLCPSLSLLRNLESLIGQIQNKRMLEKILEAAQGDPGKPNTNIDLSLKSREEETFDTIKKRLNEIILSLQKSNKTLDDCYENLNFWAANEIKKFVSHKRTLEGKSFQHYETVYIENIHLNKT